jgi:hypothetical protein
MHYFKRNEDKADAKTQKTRNFKRNFYHNQDTALTFRVTATTSHKCSSLRTIPIDELTVSVCQKSGPELTSSFSA